jgi:Mg/Co/Ni transporter MgtE
MGRLRKEALEGDPQAPAEEVMEAGPSTVRPDLGIHELAERLREKGLSTALVTEPNGTLVGVVRAQDLPG